ncbi:MAG: type II CRISPR-associated endonuclease Cas1 [Bacteroidia bacterium]|nr:type II CRISPR-associated endonuclease Cas1 [Bacteroidia bacterium]
MIKRTLYFGNEAYLKTRDQQLVAEFPDQEKPPARVPIEDIGVVILDHYQLTYTHGLMQKLLDNNVAVITCNEKRMPQGLFLNLQGNDTQTERYRIQMGASLPLRKNLWQQTIQAKIINQAHLLEMQGIDVDKMHFWAATVKSGDPDNLEGRAAAYYWRHLFEGVYEDFTRGRHDPQPNNLLNYGYAILRAVIARNLVASGMLPVFGIHHRNKYNAYCLADDVMEPFRPFVDELVLGMVYDNPDIDELNPELKRKLLQIPVLDVMINEKKSPLMVGSQQTTASLFECFDGNLRKIKYPSFERPE